ncbi:glycerol-3-phosphate acyltransferase [Clostridioides difficile]
MLLKYIILILISFLSGSIMYSYLIPKILKGIDIRKVSKDNNPGAGNVIKYCGITLGVICIILDLFKAFIPVFISLKYFHINNLTLIFVAIAPILGHAYSPFLNFNGGKAIASTFGSFLALYPISNIALTFALILIFFKFIFTIKPNSSVILVSLLFLDIIVFAYDHNLTIKLIVFLSSIILGHKHKINRNEGDITISLFNKYYKKTLYHYEQ